MMHISCPCQHRQNFDPSSNDNFISSISYPKIFGYLIPTLVAVMSANVQGTNEPLMETRRVSLCVSLVAIIFYYIAFAADNISRRYQANFLQLCGPIALIFGSLAVVSLVSIFFTLLLSWVALAALLLSWLRTNTAESLWMVVMGFTTKFGGHLSARY